MQTYGRRQSYEQELKNRVKKILNRPWRDTQTNSDITMIQEVDKDSRRHITSTKLKAWKAMELEANTTMREQ